MKTDFQTICPVCKGTAFQDLGMAAYRQPYKVAGVAIDLIDIKPKLVRCLNCTYWFFTPQIPKDRLLECYTKSSADNWTTDTTISQKRNYPMKAELLRLHSKGNRILDYGCFDGGFLEFLEPSWIKYGLEPSEKAATVAKQRGITVIGTSADDTTEEKREFFDAIVLLDVIEHINEPVALLSKLGKMLRQGGILLMETGDTDSEPFQRNERLYGYCTYVDHVGFMNRRSLNLAASLSGFTVRHFERSIHTKWPDWRYLQFICINLTFKCLYRINIAGIPLPQKLKLIASGGMPRPCRKPDHFLAILERI